MFNVGDMVSYRKCINFPDPKNYLGIIKEIGHNGFSYWYKVVWLNREWLADCFIEYEDKLLLVTPHEANK